MDYGESWFEKITTGFPRSTALVWCSVRRFSNVPSEACYSFSGTISTIQPNLASQRMRKIFSTPESTCTLFPSIRLDMTKFLIQNEDRLILHLRLHELRTENLAPIVRHTRQFLLMPILLWQPYLSAVSIKRYNIAHRIHGLVKNKAEFILPVLSLVLWLGNDFMSLAHGGDRPFERIGGLEIAMFVVEEEGFVAFPIVVFELEVLHAGGWSVVSLEAQ